MSRPDRFGQLSPANLTRVNSPAPTTPNISPFDVKTLRLTHEQATELVRSDHQIKELVTKSVKTHVEKQTARLREAIVAKDSEIAAKELENATLRDDWANSVSLNVEKQTQHLRDAATAKDAESIDEARKLQDTIASREEEIASLRDQLCSMGTDTTQCRTAISDAIQPGDLTTHGLLYEGADFTAWAARMTTILRARHGSFPAELVISKLHLTREQVWDLIEHDESAKHVFECVKKEVVGHGNEWATAMAIAFHQAAQDTPQKSAKEVWDVASKARADVQPPRPVSEGQRATNTRPQPRRDEQIADIKALCNYISPALLVRISGNALSDLDLFYNNLRRAAQPFPFLELPVVVKNRIYGIVLGSGVGNRPLRQLHGSLPPLLAICKEIRQAARPVFFGTSVFLFDLISEPDTMENTVNRVFKQWLKVVVRTDTRCLARVELSLGGTGAPHDTIDICFTISPAHGLMVNVHGKGTATLKETPQQLVNPIEEMREAMGMHGEAIGMALHSGSDLWREAVLAIANLSVPAVAESELYEAWDVKREEK